jgi:hypothetical protein
MVGNEFCLNPWVLVTLAIIIGFPWGSFILANSLRKNTNKDFDEFIKQKNRIRNMRNAIDGEYHHWPMYSRPVLFTDIDKEAQKHFYRIEYNLQQVQNLEGKITLVPEFPKKFVERMMKTWPCILKCKEIQRNIQYYKNLLYEVQFEINGLIDLHKSEKEVQQKAIRVVNELDKLINQQRPAGKLANGTEEYDNLLNWSLNASQNCLYKAREELKKQTEDSINFAIAHVFASLGQCVLKGLDIYESRSRVSRRFELDQFKEKFTIFEDVLNKIVSAEPVYNWKELLAASGQLERAQMTHEAAITSLNDFFEKQSKFSSLEKNLEQIDLLKFLNDTNELENECITYWRTRNEDDSIWAIAIQSRPLPSKRIESIRRFTQAKITPLISTEMPIKQKDLYKICEDIGSVLRDVDTVRQDIERLTRQLHLHKQAQKIVLERISSQGDIFRAVKDLQSIEKDSSPEVMTRCATCRQTLDIYIRRATAVRGANFPKLQKELDVLFHDCERVKADHYHIINDLFTQTEKYVSWLKSIKNNISQLQAEKPIINWDWDTVNKKLDASINAHTQLIRSYSNLNIYIDQAKRVAESVTKDKNQIREIRRAFNEGYRTTQVHLSEMDQELKKYKESVADFWAWARTIVINNLRPTFHEYYVLNQRWEKVINLQNIQEVKFACGQIESEIVKSLQALRRNLKTLYEKQNKFSNTYTYLMSRSKPTGPFHILPRYAITIQELCTLATAVDEEKDVEILLGSAEDLIKRCINKEIDKDMIFHIDRLVQDFRQHIDQVTVEPGAIANFATSISQMYEDSKN